MARRSLIRLNEVSLKLLEQPGDGLQHRACVSVEEHFRVAQLGKLRQLRVYDFQKSGFLKLYNVECWVHYQGLPLLLPQAIPQAR